MSNEDLAKLQVLPTNFDVNAYSTRQGRVIETLKDTFVTELRAFFETKSLERIDAVPSIEKFSADSAGNNRENDPLETIVRILRQYPDITQKLPFVGVAATLNKNLKLGMSSKLMTTVKGVPCLISGTGSFAPVAPVTPTSTTPATWPDSNYPSVPFAALQPTGPANLGLNGSDFVEITTVIDGITHVSKFIFPDEIIGPPDQTFRVVANAINLQALYCNATVIYKNLVPVLIIKVGGPLGKGQNLSIRRTNASANFDAWINFDTVAHTAPSNEFPSMNRYIMSYSSDITLTVVTDGDTIRTELTDLILNFFTFVLDDRQFMFFGRSMFGDAIGESYQVIIKDSEISCGAEAETPRNDDPERKIYSNSITIPVHMLYYIDRAVAQGVTITDDISLPPLN